MEHPLSYHIYFCCNNALYAITNEALAPPPGRCA
jgi:hypothetical protein